MTQKHTHLLTLVLFFLSCTFASAHDFEAKNDDGVTIYYNKLSGAECEVTYFGNDLSSERYSGAITIPATVIDNGTTYSVTSIGFGAFIWCEALTSISLPEGLTSIGDWAILGCEALTSISLPEGLTSIGDEAFERCESLTSISLPESVTSIGHGAFAFCI